MHLHAGQDDRQPPGGFGPHNAVNPGEVPLQDLSVKEQQCAQGLVLRRGADLFLDPEMRQEGVDLRLGHLGGMPDMLEEDEALDLPAPRWLASRQAGPMAVALVGPAAVVAGPQGFAETIQEFWLATLCGRCGRGSGCAGVRSSCGSQIAHPRAVA